MFGGIGDGAVDREIEDKLRCVFCIVLVYYRPAVEDVGG